MEDTIWKTALYSGLGLGIATEYENIRNAYHTLGRDAVKCFGTINVFRQMFKMTKNKEFVVKQFVANAAKYPDKVSCGKVHY